MTGVQSGVEALQGTITGTVAIPGDAAYDTAVSIWNGVIERRPASRRQLRRAAMTSRPRWRSRETRGLEVSVRGGGHNYAGHALCEAV